MENGHTIGPVEKKLRASDHTEFHNLCDMKNLELMQFMDDYLETPEEEYDPALFDAAGDLLNERAPIAVDIDVSASLAQLKRDHAEFFPAMREQVVAVQAKESEQLEVKAIKPAGNARRISVYRVALVAAGIAAAVTLAAYAANPELFQPVTDLGDRVIRFINWGPSGSLELPENVDKFSSLREALDATGAEDAQAQTWVPQDLELTDVRVSDVDGSPEDRAYWAIYNADKRSLLFHIESKSSDTVSYYGEKDLSSETEFTRNGITFSTETNMGTVQIKWQVGNYKYSMVGELAEDEYFHIIDSLR